MLVQSAHTEGWWRRCVHDPLADGRTAHQKRFTVPLGLRSITKPSHQKTRIVFINLETKCFYEHSRDTLCGRSVSGQVCCWTADILVKRFKSQEVGVITVHGKTDLPHELMVPESKQDTSLLDLSATNNFKKRSLTRRATSKQAKISEQHHVLSNAKQRRTKNISGAQWAITATVFMLHFAVSSMRWNATATCVTYMIPWQTDERVVRHADRWFFLEDWDGSLRGWRRAVIWHWISSVRRCKTLGSLFDLLSVSLPMVASFCRCLPYNDGMGEHVCMRPRVLFSFGFVRFAWRSSRWHKASTRVSCCFQRKIFWLSSSIFAA